MQIARNWAIYYQVWGTDKDFNSSIEGKARSVGRSVGPPRGPLLKLPRDEREGP